MAKAKVTKKAARRPAARKKSPAHPKTWAIQVNRANWPGFTTKQVTEILNNHVGGGHNGTKEQLHIWEASRWPTEHAAGELEVLVCPHYPCP